MSRLSSTKACLKQPASPGHFSETTKEAKSLASSSSPNLQLDQQTGKRAAYFRRKALIDRCVGGTMLVVTSPLTLSLYAIVKLTSPGPGFYRQERVGLNGETFEIVKLRSMVKNAEKPGKAVWCVKNDCRVTRVGRVLRKLHLDELPQLWNVAKGEMAMVGPRPERPSICEDLALQIDDYYRRVSVKPGITGLAQINLPPDETVEDAMRKQILDLHYIENASSLFDLRILFATGLRVIGIKGETAMRLMRLCRRNLIRGREFEALYELHLRSTDVDESVELEDADQGMESPFAMAGAGHGGFPRRPR